jgi:hypothetical protein
LEGFPGTAVSAAVTFVGFGRFGRFVRAARWLRGDAAIGPGTGPALLPPTYPGDTSPGRDDQSITQVRGVPPVAKLPPRTDPPGSEPVFERKAQTAVGFLHIRRYRCDATPASFGRLAPLVALWQAKRRGDTLPRWKDFAIEDFVGWHRHVALSDLAAADADPRFRIFGSGAAELMGADFTGKRLTEGIPAAARDGVIAHFAAIRDDRLIGLLMANVPVPGLEHRTFKVVELPLENDSGAVGQILHVFLTSQTVG